MKNLEIEEQVNEIKYMLKDMDEESKKYFFFKTFMKNNNKAQVLRDKFKDEVEGLNKLYFYAYVIATIRNTELKKQKQVQELTKTKENYKNILQKGKILANELKLTNSLEIANLYTYLLWNGYFSKDKALKFQSHDRDLIPGAYSNDIMNGIGVCLNFSDMLSDFMNEFDYSSAVLMNYFTKDVKVSYKADIERNVAKTKLSSKILSQLLSPIAKRIGNHAFNLINENGKLYIYDSTNLVAFKLDDKYKATLIPGKGTIKLNPYFSYYINLSEKSFNTLNLLHESKTLESPYSKKDFVITWEECLELFLNNIPLLDDFYSEIKGDIINISSTNEQLKPQIKSIIKNKYKE